MEIIKIHMIADVIPIILAIIAFVFCSFAFYKARRLADKINMLIMAVCSAILVIAQTSWWFSFFQQGDTSGTFFANVLWSLFNALSTIAFIVSALRVRPKD